MDTNNLKFQSKNANQIRLHSEPPIFFDDREDVIKKERSQDKLLCREETYAIVGAALEVLNTLGHGWNEKPYENVLVVEFLNRKIPFIQQPRYPLKFKDKIVGEFIPDLVAYGCIVIDTKVIDRITDHERGQMLNYLRITQCPVGLLLNFRRARLEWERLVFSPANSSITPQD